jgi:hypothetical protein
VIRVGKGRPGLDYARGEYNGCGFPYGPGRFYATDHVWMGLEEWGNWDRFQNFKIKEDLFGGLGHIFLDLHTREMERLIALAGGGQVWERNFNTRKLDGHVRHVTFLGLIHERHAHLDDKFVIWTWADAHVRYHWYRLVARYKTLREHALWRLYGRRQLEKLKLRAVGNPSPDSP